MSWRGHMFGVAVDSVEDLEGCEAGDAADLPVLRLEPGDLEDLPGAGEPLTTDGKGRPDLRYDPATGYALEAPGLARFSISPSGDRVRYAAGPGPAWRWQRYLIGRVLPLAVTLLGPEPVHASAVACGSTAVILAGESGAGKSTLAAELLLAGCGFVADDVVALTHERGPLTHERGPLTHERGQLLAHPGPGLISLRRPYALGEVVGSDPRGLWVAVQREPRPMSVGALYLLEEGPAAEIVPVPQPEPGRLMATSFNLALCDSGRLARMLDVYAALAAVHVARVTVPGGCDLAAVAHAILADVCSCREAA